jgi:hypothetical protein
MFSYYFDVTYLLSPAIITNTIFRSLNKERIISRKREGLLRGLSPVLILFPRKINLFQKFIPAGIIMKQIKFMRFHHPCCPAMVWLIIKPFESFIFPP